MITQENIVENANAELATLIDELAAAVLATRRQVIPNWEPVRDVLLKIRHLMADAQLAGLLLGMMSPWLPTVADLPAGTPKQVRAREPVEMGIRALADLVPTRIRGLVPQDEWRFPELDDAVDWLVNQQALVSADELATAQQQLHREAFVMDVEDVQTVQRFQSALSESLRAWESFPEFRTRIADLTDVKRSQAETLYRTNTKQAFLAGQIKTLEQPRVRNRFRWVYYAATKDNRTRLTHWALDGMVAEVGTPLHSLFLKRQTEWSCRCGLIPLDESKAERYGVSTLADVPAEYR